MSEIRVFVGEPNGTLHLGEMSEAVSAGLDVLGQPYRESDLELLLAAEKDGRDPVAFAQHIHKLRVTLRPA